ncbi:carbonic anhydrase [Nocardia abscessus]|uniref:carbonic anhydrase n=1 Tax=Nocardia abscessus TaxID=120957 RepID=UPI002458DE57|nr:carbonic anhydrase family protein [Nocardia abscessus]
MLTIRPSRSLLAVLAAVLLLPACGSDARQAYSPAPPPAHAAPHWDYDAEGPDHWADLDRDYLTCKSGHQQSPVDLPGHARLELSEHITIDYHSVPAVTLLNNGHTVQANLPAGNGNRVVVDGVPFELAQFHFHLPSEHTVDGVGTTMEAHFVHKSAAGQVAVLAVLLQAAPEPSAFAPILSVAPQAVDAATVVPGPIDLRSMLPGVADQYRYQGSLTTPPCSEGVSWTVLGSPVAVAAAEADRYRTLFAHSNRPTQPLNGRTVTLAGG